MNAYRILSEKPIIRQEGDTPAPIVIIVPEDSTINMVNYDVKFEVYNGSLRRIIAKSTQDGTIVLVGQTITIPLAESDTKGKPGIHKWEIQFYNTTPEIITAGRGKFTIVNENIA